MLVQQRMTDLLFVKYNRALKREIDACDRFNAISLKEIDECNDWLVGSMNGEDGENELGDDLTLAVIGRALSAKNTRKKKSSMPASNSIAKPAKGSTQGEKGKCVRGSTLRLTKEEDDDEEEVEFDGGEEEEEYVDEDPQFDDEEGEGYDDDEYGHY